jgi:tetratricopeptide (TPR) repeat protein
LASRRRLLGDEHPDTLNSLINMGTVLSRQNKFPEAEPYLREALRTSRRVLGDDHPDTLTALHNLGTVMRGEGKLEDARTYLRESYERTRQRLGADHPDTLISLISLGGVLVDERSPEALQLLAPAEAAARHAFVKDHAVRLGQFLCVLGAARAAGGDVDAAQMNLVEAYEILGASKGGDPSKAAEHLVNLFEARHLATPDRGFDGMAREWREKLGTKKPVNEPAGR